MAAPENMFSLKNLIIQHPGIIEYSIENYLFLAAPDESKPHILERILRRDKTISNNLVKPIFQPSKIKTRLVHNNVLPSKQLRIKHSKNYRFYFLNFLKKSSKIARY